MNWYLIFVPEPILEYGWLTNSVIWLAAPCLYQPGSCRLLTDIQSVGSSRLSHRSAHYQRGVGLPEDLETMSFIEPKSRIILSSNSAIDFAVLACSVSNRMICEPMPYR
jgi:hypothetical protein